MSPEKFYALTDELLSLAGASARGQPYANVVLKVDKVSFSLMHSGEPEDDHIEMSCDVGAAPPHARTEVFKALLVANADVLGHAGQSNFCMNRLNGHILVSCALPMRHGTAALLLEQLRHCAQDVKDWQRKYSLRTRHKTTCRSAATASPSNERKRK